VAVVLVMALLELSASKIGMSCVIVVCCRSWRGKRVLAGVVRYRCRRVRRRSLDCLRLSYVGIVLILGA
jgi:hypothetical protein